MNRQFYEHKKGTYLVLFTNEKIWFRQFGEQITEEQKHELAGTLARGKFDGRKKWWTDYLIDRQIGGQTI